MPFFAGTHSDNYRAEPNGIISTRRMIVGGRIWSQYSMGLPWPWRSV